MPSINITDPKTKEKLILDRFEVSIEGNFNKALGKDPGDRWHSCDDESSRMWPLRVSFSAHGVIDSAKEGRLKVDVSTNYVIAKDGSIENSGGFRVSLWREATGKDIGGFKEQDRIGSIIRTKADTLLPLVKASVISELTSIKKREEVASSAHAARARVAGTVISGLWKKTTKKA